MLPVQDRDSNGGEVEDRVVCLATLIMVCMSFWMSSVDINDKGDGPFPVPALKKQGLLG